MSFRISDLVDKTDTFKFVYDDFELTGRYYKYKTRTPNYAKAALATVPPELEEGTPEDLAKRETERNAAYGALGWKWFADTVIEWNAIDDQENSVPIAEETFDKLPVSFTARFREFLDELINPKKDPKQNSESS